MLQGDQREGRGCGARCARCDRLRSRRSAVPQHDHIFSGGLKCLRGGKGRGLEVMAMATVGVRWLCSRATETGGAAAARRVRRGAVSRCDHISYGWSQVLVRGCRDGDWA